MATAAPRVLLPGGLRTSRLGRSSGGSRGPLYQALARTLRNPMGMFGAAVVVLLAFAALTAPWIAPYNPIEQHAGSELMPPGGAFPLGTDNLGRDLLSRIIFGSRNSLLIGVVAVGLGAGFGLATGLAAGYLGGAVDAVIMRIYDALLSFPAILLGIGLVSVIGTGPFSVAYALAVATVPTFARLMRARVLTEREREYVTAARCIGARSGRIMWQHVLPNAVAPLIIQVSLSMGFAILAESALTFLGLGTQPPQPSWGGMLNESRAYLRTSPSFGIFPGVALATLLLGLNCLTDALRDALDPRRTNA
jgi:peptide/nickel transport system permease protein